MTLLEQRFRALLSAGPRDAASLAREAMGLSGPEAAIAKVAEAALAAAPWAEKEGGLWRIRAAPPPEPEEILLTAFQGERAAVASLRDGKLGDVRVLPAVEAVASLKGRASVAFGALAGALHLRALCRILDPARPFTTASRAAADWRLPHHGGDDARGALATLAAVWEHARARAAEQGLEGFENLRAFADAPRPVLDLAPYRFNAEFLANLPETPGTYRFLDAAGAVFYVGKARNLRNRVLSYFRVPRAPDAKWTTIVERLREIEFSILGSELEALLEERRLIRELRGSLINVQVEAHARAARRLPDRSVFVLPAASDAHAALWLHRSRCALRRVDVRLEPRGVKQVSGGIRAFFGETAASDAGDLAIAEGWLADNLERVGRLDPDSPDFEARLLGVLNGDAFQPALHG